jgi:hypothetical protein
VIGDYLGKVIRPQDEDALDNEGHFYLMYYHDYASIYPDLSKPGVHLVNHSCTPNTWMYTYYGHTLYFALRKIFPGEEITISYQLSEQDKDCNPCTHICECGAVICFQTMHLSKKRYAEWAEFHDSEEKKTKRQRVRFDHDLPPLKSYPDSIPDNPIYTLFGSEKEKPQIIDETSVPSLLEIRKYIRESGRVLYFPKLHLKIHGVFEKLLISENES